MGLRSRAPASYLCTLRILPGPDDLAVVCRILAEPQLLTWPSMLPPRRSRPHRRPDPAGSASRRTVPSRHHHPGPNTPPSPSFPVSAASKDFAPRFLCRNSRWLALGVAAAVVVALVFFARRRSKLRYGEQDE
ncbi:hypothetical protein ZWY2020_029457 [Hordeum vulgare]|nr:hypothetical protein ZWY2020_029457 [Hordeum vulgare]